MTEDNDLWPKEKLVTFIKNRDLSEEVGGAIEEYAERFPVTHAERPIFEYFLASPLIDNRSAALSALIECGKFDGYEADALLLHFDSRVDRSSTAEFQAIDYLGVLAKRGSGVAKRLLDLLNQSEYVRKMYE